MKIHFVYAGVYYNWEHEDRLRSFILKGMKKYKIKKVLVTTVYMLKWRLITKETMENYCNGNEYEKESVNDDLEKMFEDVQLGRKSDDWVHTYFLPKLTKEELDLVKRKDGDFMSTFFKTIFADVNKAEMMLSESDSKFAIGIGWRKTSALENSLPAKRIEKSVEDQPPYKKACTVQTFIL